MKYLILILALFASATHAAKDELHEAFASTTTCSIILGAAANEAEQNLAFDRDAPGVFIGDWVEMQLASNIYQSASARYGAKLKAANPEYSEFSYEQMLDAVYRNVSEMTDEQIAEMGKACIEGYLIARERVGGKGILL